MNHPYPVSYDIDRPQHYNRWTVAFRIILAIPQLILVGWGSFQFLSWTWETGDNGRATSNGLSNGILITVMLFVVFLAWFAILFTGRFPRGMRDFCLMIFRWAENVAAYMALQAAPYPPFGRGEYPLRLTVTPAEHYNRWAVAFRIILVIPHAILLAFLTFAQVIVTIVAWFGILFTGQYPAGLWEFSVGVSRWTARVYAYALLFVDEYPPFSLAARPGSSQMVATPA
jgi:hypothetical protein